MSIKVDFIDEAQLEKETKDEKFGIAVRLESLVGKLDEWDSKIDELIVAYTTKNGKRVYAHNIEYNEEKETVSFLVSQPCPEYAHWYDEVKKPIATTFVDFCWLSSDGTKPESIGEVKTPIDDDAKLGDLTWALPQRFCDNLVMMVHTMAEVVSLDLQEAVMYGPIQYRNDQ